MSGRSGSSGFPAEPTSYRRLPDELTESRPAEWSAHRGSGPLALAFGAPCVGGLVGSRLARPLVARFGTDPVLCRAGMLRACWSLELAFVQPGVTGPVLVIAVQLALVTSVGVFNPVFATYRLEQTPAVRVARTLSAWSVSSSATVAALTALWGLLAGLIGPRAAIAAAGGLLLATPLLLSWPRMIRISPGSVGPGGSARSPAGKT